MANNPDFWDRLLAQCGETRPVVAGGAIRDYLLGAENPKDIDIFYNRPGHVEGAARFQAIEDLAFWQDTMAPEQPGFEEYQGQPGVFRVTNHIVDETNIQLIGVQSVAEHLNQFDWSMCRVWYNSNGLHMSNAASQGWGERKNFLLNSNSLFKSIQRWDAWNDRENAIALGDWTAVISGVGIHRATLNELGIEVNIDQPEVFDVDRGILFQDCHTIQNIPAPVPADQWAQPIRFNLNAGAINMGQVINPMNVQWVRG